MDDKGQLYLHLKAVEAHIAERGKLPVNVVFLVEGEEEVGSPNLEALPGGEPGAPAVRRGADLRHHACSRPGLPSITIGLRGLAYMEVRVQGPQADLHSGSYGGAVVNPANALAGIIARLKDERGRVTIPGFYDDVRELTAAEREAIARAALQRGGAARGGGRAGARRARRASARWSASGRARRST